MTHASNYSVNSSPQFAIVTGASSGIGAEIARCLAQKNYNIIAVGRNTSGLQAIKSKIEQESPVKVETFICDLSSKAETEHFIENITSYNIAILVNNAGFGVHGLFEKTSLTEELNLVSLQINATLLLTKTLLPALKKHSRSYILNIGSVYSMVPVPKQAVYCACKGFLKFYSDAIRAELLSTGVHVSLACPGVTFTQFRKRSGIKDKKTFGMTSDKVASIIVDQMFAGKATIIPGFVNKFLIAVTSLLPSPWVASLMVRVNRFRGIQNAQSEL